MGLKSNWKSTVAAFAMVVSASAASAATTYDLTTSTSGPFSFTCDVGGFLNTGCDVVNGPNGVGVNGRPDLVGIGQIDSEPGFETLVVTFDTAVRLFAFTLGLFSGNDDYDLAIDGGAFSNQLTSNPYNAGGQIVNSFSIRASSSTGFLGGDLFNDEFTLASITIEPVPLPAAGWLLLAGIAGIAGLRRKKST